MTLVTKRELRDYRHQYREVMKEKTTEWLLRYVTPQKDDNVLWQIYRRECRHELSRRGVAHE